MGEGGGGGAKNAWSSKEHSIHSALTHINRFSHPSPTLPKSVRVRYSAFLEFYFLRRLTFAFRPHYVHATALHYDNDIYCRLQIQLKVPKFLILFFIYRKGYTEYMWRAALHISRIQINPLSCRLPLCVEASKAIPVKLETFRWSIKQIKSRTSSEYHNDLAKRRTDVRNSFKLSNTPRKIKQSLFKSGQFGMKYLQKWIPTKNCCKRLYFSQEENRGLLNHIL